MARQIVGSMLVAAALAVAGSIPVAAQAPAAASDADTLIAQAMQLHQAGDLLGAIQKYQIALETAPDRADARSNLAVAYAALGRIEEAVAEYRRALSDRDDPAIRLNLGIALYKSGQIDAAIPELQHVLQADASTRQAALLLADSLLQAGRDQEVVDLLTPREAAFGEDLGYAYVLGTALLKLGETERGQVLIDRIFSRGESAEGHLLMGLAHLGGRDYPNALKELDRAVALNPELPTVHVLHGRALLNMGNREAAIRAFRRELERDPNNYEANVQLGNLYRMDQQHEQSLLFFDRASAIRPGDVSVKHGMAAAHLALNNPERARELLELVVKEAPSFVEGHVLLATTYYRLKRREDGDREREIVQKLTAENQAKQPGARQSEESRDEPGSARPTASAPQPSPPPQGID